MLLLFLVLSLAGAGFCAKQCTTPVVFMHGLRGSEQDGRVLAFYIAQQHPGQPFYSLPVDDGDLSFKSLYEQIKDVQDSIQTLIDSHPDEFANGFHLVGHSQGGLLTRAVVEESDRFNIRNYVSLAGVQGGEYGHCDFFGSGDCEALTEYLYSDAMRNTSSVAQFWRHPNPDVYKENVFLPVINNEVNPDPRRKNNMLRLKHMFLFGSDGGLFLFVYAYRSSFFFCLFVCVCACVCVSAYTDEIISPWQSSLLGFWDTNGQSVVPMEKQNYYVQDTFGLRTLNETNRLTLTSLPNRAHGSWIVEEDVILQYVLPALED